MGLRSLTPLRSSGGGGGSSLLTGLVSYWNFNETTGTRADQLGVNDLSVLGGTSGGSGIGFTTGIIGNAMSDSNGGSISTASGLTPPAGSFTFAFWINFTTVSGLASDPVMFSQMGSKLDFWLVQNSNTIGFKASADNSNVSEVDSSVTLTSGTTYFVIVYYDNVNHLLGISINNGTADTASFTGPVYQSGTDPFCVGNYTGHSGLGLVGWIDEMGYWSRLLTSGEKASLYNGGAGTTYPF